MSLLMWKMKSLEGAPVVERNEEFPIDSVGISRIYLAVCLLSVPLLSAPFPLFLWPFDLSERVWSFKVLLFPLSGVPLFLHSGLGFQSCGSFVHWLGGSGGWGWGTGFYEAVRLRWGWRGIAVRCCQERTRLIKFPPHSAPGGHRCNMSTSISKCRTSF